MSHPVLLNNVEHKDLKIILGRGTRFGDGETICPTFPAEFRNVLAHYPILFRETGNQQRYEPVALFGFVEGENLFAGLETWDALYVPMAIARQPFSMGLSGDSVLVQVDLDHPKVSTTVGHPLFLEYGGESELLEQVSSLLLALHQGLQSNAGFVAALLEYDLIEPLTLDIELNNGSQNRLRGFSTINEEKLAALDAAALAHLHRHGYLLAAHLMVASLVQLRELIERKNGRVGVDG
jgi:hypothetical protein